MNLQVEIKPRVVARRKLTRRTRKEYGNICLKKHLVDWGGIPRDIFFPIPSARSLMRVVILFVFVYRTSFVGIRSPRNIKLGAQITKQNHSNPLKAH